MQPSISGAGLYCPQDTPTDLPQSTDLQLTWLQQRGLQTTDKCHSTEFPLQYVYQCLDNGNV